jgi:hypothetical protein
MNGPERQNGAALAVESAKYNELTVSPIAAAAGLLTFLADTGRAERGRHNTLPAPNPRLRRWAYSVRTPAT